MNSSFDWNKYNAKRNSQAIKIHNYNLRSNFNYFESNHYNHIRDIYALSLLLLNKKKKETRRVLDYGGNLIVHANLINKISIKNLIFYIYNPFSQINKKKLSFKYKFLNNQKHLFKKKFDLLYFGSSLQYLENLSDFENLDFIQNCKFILITHTPVTFDSKEKLVIKQKNQINLYQNIYSIKYIEKKLLKKKFKLIFKSINDFKYSGLRKKYKNLNSVNMLFEKK